MKTKKIELVSLVYLISFVIIFAISLYLSSIFVQSIVWIWVIASSVAVLLRYSMYRHIKKLLFVDLKKYLELKIQKKDWPDGMKFPMRDDIKKWIDRYSLSVEMGFPKTIWDKIMRESSDVHIENILKQLSVSVIGVNRGISLFDLYYLESVYVEKAEFNTDTCHELEQTIAFLEYMPVRDLTVYVHPPIHLTSISLHYLMIRDEKIGNFNEVCLSLMKSKCEIIAPMTVIEQLISQTNAVVPVVFPQRFLAYLIKMEVENRFNLKADPEKRKKVFDWYMSQAVQEFDFYSYWPKFTEEEITCISSKFTGDALEQIWEKQQLWSLMSSSYLRVHFMRYKLTPSSLKDFEELRKECERRSCI